MKEGEKMKKKIVKCGKFAFVIPYLLIPFADKIFADIPMLPFLLYPFCWIVSAICFFCARKTEQQEIESIRSKIIFGCIIVFLAIQAVIALN